MLTSSPTNAQAQALLQTLCKFMLPFIQTALGQTTDPKNIHFGIEADEFVIELEKFISGVISRFQPHDQDISIEAQLDEDFLHQAEEVAMTTDARSTDKENPEHVLTNQDVIHESLAQSVELRSMPLGSDEEALGRQLRELRGYVTQHMPIRLLRFEPHNSKLKITLLDRADVYNYLALELRTNFSNTFKFGRFVVEYAKYAILSHTWTHKPGELTYTDWKNGSLDATQPNCRKLIGFCKSAWKKHGLTLGWIDTVCINKESSAELDESIRSMYAWYGAAAVCITYLAGTGAIQDMHNDPWFTRGWTFQELLAPQRIKFYNMDWNQLSSDADDKRNLSIQAEIKLATTITSDELQDFQRTSISRRMQLAAKREVTRGEDIAYCLMGIFSVSISTAYGEGAQRAFFRLVEEIFRLTKDVSDIFNSGGDEPSDWKPPTSLFPSHPSDYLNRSENDQLVSWHPIEPLILTHLGLRTPILLMPATPLRDSVGLPIGNFYATASVSPCVGESSGLDVIPKNYVLLDKKLPERENGRIKGTNIRLTFGALNVEVEQETNIRVPKVCLAILLRRQVGVPGTQYDKVYTEIPIVFDLKKARNNYEDDPKYYYLIKRSQLSEHGMQLVTLYL